MTNETKHYAVTFIGAGLSFQQVFHVRASSEASARAELLRQARGATICTVSQVEPNRGIVFAQASESLL